MENPETFEPEVEYPEIAREILAMAEEDQAMRAATMEDPEEWDVELDRKNTKRLKEIVEEIGWPTVSKVGEDGSKMAWLLVQHVDKDLEFQKYCLGLMQEAEEGEIDLANVAYLEDRIRTYEDMPQLYGTQFHTDKETGELVPYPIEDIDNVDERRASVGLDSFEEYREHMVEKYGKK